MEKLRTIQWVLVAAFVSIANTGCAQSNDLQESLEALLPEMILIQGGTFRMGDMAEEGDANELPVHQVTVGDFKIANIEVTYDLMDFFLASTGREPHKKDEEFGREGYPATYVSYQLANELIAWLNQQTGRSFRLPTEAEWEYAARAGTDTAFPWGDSMSRAYGNYGPNDCCVKGDGIFGEDKWQYTSPVASFIPNPWGLYDTAGNVWEWTADCWNDTYEGAPTDGSAWMTGDCDRGPLRGGSWTHYSRNVRAANRNDNFRDHAVNGYGMRLAEDI